MLAEMAALQQTVAAEAQTVAQFVDLLKLEQASLSSGNTDELPAYAEQKMGFAARLNALAAQRNAALAALGFTADRAGVDAWCAQHPGDAATAWAAVLSLAADARRLNRLNGDLIQIRLRYNAKALEALRGGSDSLNLYGPDGQSRTAGCGRINHSV